MYKKISSVLVAFVFASAIFIQVVLAQSVPPLKVYLYIHTNPNTSVGAAYPNSYLAFKNIPGAQVVHRNIVGWSRDQFQAQLQKDFSTPGASNMVVYGGHGVIGGLGTDGNLNFNRAHALADIGQAARNNGTTASAFIESCGSGIVCNIGNLPDGINGVFTASTADKPGWVYKGNGQPWKAEFGEDIKNAMSNFGTGTSKDPDTNKDGVVTAGELDKALNNGKPGRSKVPNPDAPIFFKDQETADKYSKTTECILLRPGQVDNNYVLFSYKEGDITIKLKPESIIGYGNRTKFRNEFPVRGQVRDVEKSDESELNFDLRRLGSDFIEDHIKEVLSVKPANSVTARTVLLPSEAQAKEFVTSLGGSSAAQGQYTLGSQKVDVGKRYIARHPSPQDKIVFDDQCNPSEWKPLEPEPGKNPDNGGDGGENGGGDQGGGGGGSQPGAGGGLDSLLSSLMQALLGKQGQQANQQGQNPYGAGYGNEQPIDPVCGTDGKTYKNDYYRAQYTSLKNTGVCVSPSTGSGQATPNVNSIVTLTQLSQSGIPATLLENVRNLVSSVLSNILAGANVAETTVR
ncbi:MAG: hypothetical protein O3A36_03960 [bacterium]|nr:hypothetical protein [bacterium]